MARYPEPKPGEWIQPVSTGYKLGCCDCGSVHRMDFRIYKGRVQFRAFRAPRATAAMRAAMTKANRATAAIQAALKKMRERV